MDFGVSARRLRESTRLTALSDRVVWPSGTRTMPRTFVEPDTDGTLSKVRGCRPAARFGNRSGRMSSDKKPSTNRSSERRLGARCRDRLRMRSCCLISRFSATRPLAPPGPTSRATAVRRWTSSIRSPFIGASLDRRVRRGKIAKSLIFGEYRNSPGTRKKYRAALANFQVWCHKNCRLPKKELFAKLNSTLRG